MTGPQFAAAPQPTSPQDAALARPVPAPAADPAAPAAARDPQLGTSASPPVDPHVLGGRRDAAERSGAGHAQRRAAESSIAKRRAQARAAERAAQRGAATGKAERRQPGTRRAASDHAESAPIEPPVATGQSTFGAIRLGQVISWQVAVAGVLAVHRLPLATMVPVATVCALILALTVVRVRRRWLYEWAGIWLRYAIRSRSGHVAESAASLVRATDRTIGFGRLEVDGVTAAVVTSSTGYCVVIDPLLEDRAFLSAELPQLPSLGDLLPGNDPTEPAVSIQQLTLMIPAPNATNREDAAARSYRELGGGAVPARSRTWIVVQATVTADTRGWPELQAALVNTTRRLQRRLTKAGFNPRLVSEQQLAADVTALLRADAAPAQSPTVEERWNSWGMAGAFNAAYAVIGWPQHSAAAYARLLDELHRLPTTATTIALNAARDGEYVDVQAVLRITEPDLATLRSLDAELSRIAAATGIALRRLDGEHVHGVRATLPAGGFAA